MLKRVPLFEGISELELERVFSGMKISVVHFQKGEVIARADESCNRMIILLTGVVKGEMTDPSGKVIKVEDIPAPYPVATLFVFSRGIPFPVQLTVKEEVSALVIPANIFFNMLLKSEILLRNYLYLSTLFAYRLVQKIHFLSFLTIRQKLALYFLELSTLQKSDTVKINMTHAALAEYFGVSRQSIERDMKNMVVEGYISISKKEITIVKKYKLEHIVKFSG